MNSTSAFGWAAEHSNATAFDSCQESVRALLHSLRVTLVKALDRIVGQHSREKGRDASIPMRGGIISVNKPVKDIVLEMPASARVLEQLGIDYCCGGARSLDEACRAAGLDVKDVVQSLEATIRTTHTEGQVVDWSTQPLATLMNNIVNQHHAFCRQEVGRQRASSTQSIGIEAFRDDSPTNRNENNGNEYQREGR